MNPIFSTNCIYLGVLQRDFYNQGCFALSVKLFTYCYFLPQIFINLWYLLTLLPFGGFFNHIIWPCMKRYPWQTFAVNACSRNNTILGFYSSCVLCCGTEEHFWRAVLPSWKQKQQFSYEMYLPSATTRNSTMVPRSFENNALSLRKK